MGGGRKLSIFLLYGMPNEKKKSYDDVVIGALQKRKKAVRSGACSHVKMLKKKKKEGSKAGRRPKEALDAEESENK